MHGVFFQSNWSAPGAQHFQVEFGGSEVAMTAQRQRRDTGLRVALVGWSCCLVPQPYGTRQWPNPHGASGGRLVGRWAVSRSVST